MKRPNRKLNAKDVDKLLKVCSKIDKLKEIINKAQQELATINFEHSWVRYLDEDSLSALSYSEEDELGKATEKIIYCNK